MRYLSIIAVLFTFNLNAQQLSRSVVTAAGDYSSNGGYSLSSTIGEVITETYRTADSSRYLTQGFQQWDDEQVFVKQINTGLDLNIFPNPTSNYINIRMSAELAGTVELQLYDMIGNTLNIMKSANYLQGRVVYTYNISALPAGIYLLRAIDKTGEALQAYQIIKTN